MNSNQNLNPLANHFRARNVSSDAKSGFATRSISGNNGGGTAQWNNNAPDNHHVTSITTSPTRPVQAPRTAQQPGPAYNSAAQTSAVNTAPQPQLRAMPAPQSHVPAQYPAQQTAPHTPPRPASSSPPNALSGVANRTPSPNSTPPSQPSPSPSPQRPAHLSAGNTPPLQQPPLQHAPYQPPQQQYVQQPPQPQQYAQQQPRAASVNLPTARPAQQAPLQPQQSVAPPQQLQQQVPHVPPPQPAVAQEPVVPVHEQATQEDLNQSIPDDMLMALDDAQMRLNEQHAAVQPHSAASMQHEQHVTPVIHEPAPPQQQAAHSVASEELERLRREVAQLKHDKSKEEELSRVHNQLQNARADLATVRTHLNTTARKDTELKREMELLKEQLAWKDQELREVRMTALDQPAPTPSQDTRMLEASDQEHVVYNVNTQSDESEQHSVNDHSTHVLNLRMKVGATNTQANNSAATAGSKHSPNNLQQLQIQGTTAKNRSPNSNKTPKASPTQPSTKKATVPSKGHKRSRDEMSRGHDEDEVGEPISKENEKLKLALYKARLRLHNIKKAILTDGSEEKSQNNSAANLEQLKAELLDCIQMQMTSQFDALKAEISTLAHTPRVTVDEDEPPTKKRKISEQAAQSNEEAEKLVESLRGQIAQLTQQHHAARDEADKSRQTSESLNHMLTELKHVREQDVQRSNKVHEERAELLQRATGLEAELVKCRAAVELTDQLREQVQSLQAELAQARDELTALRTRGEAAERQLVVAEQRAGELDQLFQDECAKAARYQDENGKLQHECDKLKVVCKQLYLQIKSNKAGALNNSGNLATSSEGQPGTEANTN